MTAIINYLLKSINVKYILLLFILLSSFSVIDAQRLENKAASNLEDNALFAMQDSTASGYEWSAATLGALKRVFNPWRTPYGKVAGVDDEASLHGVLIKEDSIELNYEAISHNGIVHSVTWDWNWEKVLNSRLMPILEDRTVVFSVDGGLNSNNDVTGWQRYFKNDNASNHISLNRQLVILPKRDTDTIYAANQGYSFFLQSDSDKQRHGQSIANYSYGANKKYSGLVIASDSVNNPSFLFIHSNTKYKNWTQTESSASVIFHEKSTIINNSLNAKAGIKIAQLSYIPSTSTDLQAEAATAEVGTMWLKDISGSMYLITKTSSTKLARVAFAEW